MHTQSKSKEKLNARMRFVRLLITTRITPKNVALIV